MPRLMRRSETLRRTGKTKKISKKEIPKIAGKWNLIFKENR
jgi:hypothetical protein